MSYGFVYYPSAYYPLGYSSLGMWIKYKPVGQQTKEVKVVDSAPGWVHIDCPDREILAVRNLLNVDPPRPLNGNWDEFIPLSLTNSCAAAHPTLDRYMINYEVHNGKPHKDPRMRVKNSFLRDGKASMSDSGGFQILSGKVSWIDPKDVGNWYAENVDEGITLDIPVFRIDDMDLIARTAKIQVKNSKIIRDLTPDNFRLFNVSHGLDVESSKMFRGILEKDKDCGDYICVGGAYNGTLISSLFRLAQFILDPNGKQYKQYHILGIYNTAFLSSFIRMAALLRKHHRKDIILSSDASTQVYSAGNRTMHLQRAHYRNAERLYLGKAAPIYEQNPHRLLPCTCHVCSSLKYVDIVSHVDDAIIAHIFIFHNMMEIQRWVYMMNDYAETLSDEDYRELVSSQLAGSPSQKSALVALDMVTMAIKDGVDLAGQVYSPYLSSMSDDSDWLKEAGDGLEGDVDISELTGGNWIQDVHIPKLIEVCDLFEKYHSKGVVDVKSAAPKDQKRTAKKVMSNTTHAKAGSRKKPLVKREKIDPAKGTHSKSKKEA